MGDLMAMLGISKWASHLDQARDVPPQTTETFLKMVSKRRNRIAHTGDRSGRTRAQITSEEVTEILVGLRSVVTGLDGIVTAHFAKGR